MEQGTPSKQELVLDVKNFFEGPINLDMMILGTAKSFITDASANSDGEDLKSSAAANLTGLQSSLMYSQHALKLLEEYGLVEEAYMHLKHSVGPEV